MKTYEATEQAYKNGYEKGYEDGKRDAVKHGRWGRTAPNRYGHPCHPCLECGFLASYQDKNYCPNCGARMDGDRSGN